MICSERTPTFILNTNICKSYQNKSVYAYSFIHLQIEPYQLPIRRILLARTNGLSSPAVCFMWQPTSWGDNRLDIEAFAKFSEMLMPCWKKKSVFLGFGEGIWGKVKIYSDEGSVNSKAYTPKILSASKMLRCLVVK